MQSSHEGDPRPASAEERAEYLRKVEALASDPATKDEAQALLLRAQSEAVKKVQASGAEMLYTPNGLRGLFPTNSMRFIVRRKKRAARKEG
jgi:hypothetical protein